MSRRSRRAERRMVLTCAPPARRRPRRRWGVPAARTRLPKPAKRPRGRQMTLCRAARSDRGSSAVELAVLAPALMLICMLILQFGLWFNARQTALAAAQAGAVVA